MSDVPVCVIGCGPIGLAASLLLSRHGVPVLLVERRSELNTHPRSRFVDANTMELMREFGVEKMVEDSGLGPDWTAYNRWAVDLATTPYAELESPTFLSVPGPDSPCLPVMTVQDEVEKAMMTRVVDDPSISMHFDTEVVELTQSDVETTLILRDTRTDQRRTVTSTYTLGADGPGSSTRAVIGTTLEGSPQPIHMQDVIFHADLSPYVGDRKGALLYTQPSAGVLIFQPLDGVRRWRCQVSTGQPDLISEKAIRTRILASLGTSDDVELDIVSMRMWQPTPGATTRFSHGRIFLVGDAAHVSVPTGGLGNNAGFSGARNLAWKLAYVLRGLVPASILDTYEEEHKPVALERIEYGVATTTVMGRMMLGHRAGMDVSEHIEGTKRYADYDYLLRGYELSSELIAPNLEPAPEFVDPARDFRPLVRNGWRAPHVWVDDAETESVLDWYGNGYVLLVGPECDAESWQVAMAELPGGVPIEVRRLPAERPVAPYEKDGVVLVRPDAVIAQHLSHAGGTTDLSAVTPYLPTMAH
ncbi:MAG: FAD-dependent monooxygenase [Acidimicrobiaceae bacterium]|nr:FAD-dependent monooxygenase [Acidimicrobiaceae bacterium]